MFVGEPPEGLSRSRTASTRSTSCRASSSPATRPATTRRTTSGSAATCRARSRRRGAGCARPASTRCPTRRREGHRQRDRQLHQLRPVRRDHRQGRPAHPARGRRRAPLPNYVGSRRNLGPTWRVQLTMSLRSLLPLAAAAAALTLPAGAGAAAPSAQRGEPGHVQPDRVGDGAGPVAGAGVEQPVVEALVTSAPPRRSASTPSGRGSAARSAATSAAVPRAAASWNRVLNGRILHARDRVQRVRRDDRRARRSATPSVRASR